jgi:hypothetical protein
MPFSGRTDSGDLFVRPLGSEDANLERNVSLFSIRGGPKPAQIECITVKSGLLQIESYSKTPSGGAPFVAVMQTANFSNRNNPADQLHRTRVGRIFIQGQMETASVISRCFILTPET